MTRKQIEQARMDLPPLMYWDEYSEAQKQLSNELSCREMINSCLCYETSFVGSPYENDFIEMLGKQTVDRLYAEQCGDFFTKALVKKGVYTDSEGLSYNSVMWDDEKLLFSLDDIAFVRNRYVGYLTVLNPDNLPQNVLDSCENGNFFVKCFISTTERSSITPYRIEHSLYHYLNGNIWVKTNYSLNTLDIWSAMEALTTSDLYKDFCQKHNLKTFDVLNGIDQEQSQDFSENRDNYVSYEDELFEYDI